MVKPVIIQSARHRPFEIAVAAACLISSVLNLIGVRSTRTLMAIDNVIPGYDWIWYVGTSFGAFLVLLSAFLAIPNALIVERIGLSILFFLFFSYSFASIVLEGAGGYAGAYYLIAFTVGALFRMLQINKELRALEAA